MRTPPYRDPGEPDLRSPGRYLVWLTRLQLRTLAGAMAFGVLWMLAPALMPAALGLAINRGIVGHDSAQLLLWCGVILALGVLLAVCGTFRHRFAVTNWLVAAFRSASLVGRHATRVGAALGSTLPTGDIVNIVASDCMRVGGVYDMAALFSGSIVSYLVIAVIVIHISPALGALVLIGVPVLVLCISPLLGPLHRKQSAQRDAAGKLSALGADTVAGLRVLRGVGGEPVFLERYHTLSEEVRREGVVVAAPRALLDAGQVALPAVFILALTWQGARLAVDGTLNAGQLVALYGYAAFLVMPVRIATEFADRATRSYIGARKLITLMSVQPTVSDPAKPRSLPEGPLALEDPTSGLTVTPGRLTVVVSRVPEHAAAIADRLGRLGDAPEGGGPRARVGGINVDEVTLDELRSRVVVSDAEPRLFAGELRHELDPKERGADKLDEAIMTASAADVVDALPEGLATVVDEGGRGLSGGQRQRMALVRALVLDPEVLVLVDPTSAVDSHTETRIARELARARHGETTVIITASPLIAEVADEVHFVDDGLVVAHGTHQHLLATSGPYRQAMLRDD